jgi:hypothetical protein
MTDCSDINTATSVVELIKDGGIITVLLAGLWAFIKGQIVPKGYVDELKKHADNQTKLLAQELVKELNEGQSRSIQTAIVAAFDEINGKTNQGTA